MIDEKGGTNNNSINNGAAATSKQTMSVPKREFLSASVAWRDTGQGFILAIELFKEGRLHEAAATDWWLAALFVGRDEWALFCVVREGNQ